MNVEKVQEIKSLISKAEMESAKSQGIIDDIKAGWKEKYGTDNVSEIESKLESLRAEYKKKKDKLEKLYQDLLDSNDWDKLAGELA